MKERNWIADAAFRAFAAFLDGLERQGSSFERFASTTRSEGQFGALESYFGLARAQAENTHAPVAERVAAVPLLGRVAESRADDIKRLGGLLGIQNPATLQSAALAALGRQKDRDAADVLIGAWSGLSPTLRIDTLNILLTRPDWCRALLVAIEKGQVPAAQIGTSFQQKLLTHPDRTVHDRAAELFARTSTDRSALLKQYAVASKLAGDRERGMALFRQQCATCHRLRGEGSDVGPDLGSMQNKDVSTLLIAVLDPNQTVEPRYVSYTATTRDGRELSGIISSESANSITLRAPGGQDQTVLRSELANLASTGLSLMPDGFEKALTPEAMADLFAAVRGN